MKCFNLYRAGTVSAKSLSKESRGENDIMKNLFQIKKGRSYTISQIRSSKDLIPKYEEVAFSIINQEAIKLFYWISIKTFQITLRSGREVILMKIENKK